MLNIGDYVEFSLFGSDEITHKTSDYQGKVIVLYAYPRDNTPGCTVESKAFSDLIDDFQHENAIVLGINHNSLKSHKNFISKHCLPFTLLIDEDLKLLDQLGAKKEEKKVYRKTFIIDEEGKLEKIFDKVSVKTHAEEVLDYVKNRKK